MDVGIIRNRSCIACGFVTKLVRFGCLTRGLVFWFRRTVVPSLKYWRFYSVKDRVIASHYLRLWLGAYGRDGIGCKNNYLHGSFMRSETEQGS